MLKKTLLFALALLTAATTFAKKDIAKHVIIIGLDGWGSYCMQTAKVPFIRQCMAEGSYTLYKRTMRPSDSGPNWAAQMNGTPVEMTGIISNDSEPQFKPLYLTEHNAQPTFFHIMRQKHPNAELGVVCEWGDFLDYADTLCLSYFKRIRHASQNPELVVKESCEYIKQKKPNICFIHIDAIDHAGHTYGRGTPELFAALEHADGQVRQIVDAVKEAGIYDDTIIILTADHGHEGASHGGDSLNEIETPLVVFGKGVRKGYVITDTVLQIDVAATVARIFNLPLPQSWRGKPVEVFR